MRLLTLIAIFVFNQYIEISLFIHNSISAWLN